MANFSFCREKGAPLFILPFPSPCGEDKQLWFTHICDIRVYEMCLTNKLIEKSLKNNKALLWFLSLNQDEADLQLTPAESYHGFFGSLSQSFHKAHIHIQTWITKLVRILTCIFSWKLCWITYLSHCHIYCTTENLAFVNISYFYRVIIGCYALHKILLQDFSIHWRIRKVFGILIFFFKIQKIKIREKKRNTRTFPN